jgi:hypothetical protein
MKVRKLKEQRAEPARDALDAGGEAAKTRPTGKDVQPGTAQKGKSWQSGSPHPDDEEEKLESALEDSFPASDPPAPAQPMATGWEVIDKQKKQAND